MPIRWELIPKDNPLSGILEEKARICDECEMCEEWGRCMASECRCFALSLLCDESFVCPLGKF